MEIRPVLKDDIPGIKSILDSTLLFPSAYLDEMIADYFTNSESRDIWFVSVDTDKITSFGYCGPERITDGTYNLYAIAVLNESQGKGIGTRMMGFIENKLRESGHRILLVETSGTEQYARTREFYHRLKYNKEAVIREFYGANDDKVVFWKKLN